jgi:CBS domain containing-hemolysin-like protein
MLLGTLVLLTLLAAAQFVRGTLSEFSWSRLEKRLNGKSELLSRIYQGYEDVAASFKAIFWVLFGALGILTAYSGAAGSIGDNRYLILWLSFLAFQLLIARPLASAFAEDFLAVAWTTLESIAMLARPIVIAEDAIERLLHRSSGREEPAPSIQEELLSVVHEGKREGAIKLENAAHVIEGLIDLHNIRVSDIMTPRINMVMLPASDTVEDARKLIAEEGHSRVPVHGDNRDEVLGVLYAKDLLPHLGATASGNAPLSSVALLQPAYIPETKPVDVLLREFQQTHVHIAIVLDEFGGVAGLVTMEDILEEIVGEIADEYDEREAPPLQRIDDHTLEASGRIRLDELNAVGPFSFPEEGPFDTLAGLILHEMGRVPKPGESMEYNDLVLTVVTASRRTVDRVRIKSTTPFPVTESAPATGRA